MADNTLLNPGTGGDSIATDDVGGVKFQRVKMTLGADGINGGDVSTANPLPITSPNIPALGQAAMAASQPVAIAFNQTAVPVTFSTRVIVGAYGCNNAAAVAGAVGLVNVASLENPIGSGRVLYVRRCQISLNGVNSVLAISYGVHMDRSSGMPSAGTTVAAQKRATADSAPVGIFRSGPTGTPAAGELYSAIGVSYQNNTSGAPALYEAIDGIGPEDDVIVVAGEALIVTIDASDVDLRAIAHFWWQEA